MPIGITALLASQLMKPFLKAYGAGHEAAFGPGLDEVEQTYGKDTRDNVEATTHSYGVSGVPGAGYSAKLKKGSAESNRIKVATVTWEDVKKIAEDKMVDLNAFKISSAMKMIAGTARSMGINIKGNFPEDLK